MSKKIVSVYDGYYDMDSSFKISGSLVNGFDYDAHKGQIRFIYFDGFSTYAVADIEFSKTDWRKIARCQRPKLLEKLKELFADEM